jgi:hypothetical protein
MRRAALVLGLLGCSAPPVTESPEPLVPLTAGATVYILEVYDDWLDDGSPDILSRSPGLDGAYTVGEQALRIILRAASRGRSAHLARVEDFEAQDGVLSRLSFPEPVSYLVPSPDGKFELRRHTETAGFELTILPLLLGNSQTATVVYTLKRKCAIRSRIPGTDLAAGEPVFEDVCLKSGRTGVPLGASMLWMLPKGAGRSDAIILHLASVAPFGN